MLYTTILPIVLLISDSVTTAKHHRNDKSKNALPHLAVKEIKMQKANEFKGKVKKNRSALQKNIENSKTAIQISIPSFLTRKQISIQISIDQHEGKSEENR
jgi:hypothetical protein